MTRGTDLEHLQDELVEAFVWGGEDRARELVSVFGPEPRVRPLLEAMLHEADPRARQAAAFGLGVLGGPASIKCLEQQLALEEAREDYDGDSVVEEIIRALGRIEDPGARAALVRVLKRRVAAGPESGEVHALALALWKRRHPELLSVVRQSLGQLDPKEWNSLQGLLVLLEKTPDELRAWARDPLVPVKHKTRVVTVLDAELPEALATTLPSFISAASALSEEAVSQQDEARYYCDRLFTLLLLHKERVLPTFSEEARAELRTLARRLITSADSNCSLGAAVVLKLVGHPEDAALLDAHRPAEPTLAKVFDDSARALRQPRRGM
jgi:hypothetical protein